MVKFIMLLMLYAAAGIYVSCESNAAPTRYPPITSENAVLLYGSITPLEKPIVMDLMLKLNDPELDTVYILINSTGGLLDIAGLISISMATTSPSKNIVCIAGEYAFSAAFFIWADCPTRMVLPTSKLLFHPAVVYDVQTGTPADPQPEEIKIKNEIIINRMISILGMPKEIYMPAWKEEKMWTVVELMEHTRPGLFEFVPGYLQLPRVMYLDIMEK